MSRFSIWCGVLSIAIFGACQTHSPRQQALQRACDYLWARQEADGSWRSEVHGLLKQGKAYTPFILLSLAQVSDTLYPHPKQKKAKALDFVRRQARQTLSGAAEAVLEYPVYTMAYSLMVLSKMGTAADDSLRRAIAAYLLQQQFTHHRHIDSTHQAYGGWGFGETRLARGEVGHVDISHTRRVLQALRLTGQLPDSTAAHARLFLSRCISPADASGAGGFFYSPVLPLTNKAGTDAQGHFKPYATATADGLLSLLCVYPKQAPAIRHATQWLAQHPSLEYVAGISPDDAAQWHTVMVLYHLAVRAEAYQALKIRGDWQEDMLKVLLPKQQADGSFANPLGARNKENDPLLGTALALRVLVGK